MWSCLYFSVLSFHNMLFLSEWHRGGDRAKLTKCDTSEWDKKCRYVNDVLFECPHG